MEATEHATDFLPVLPVSVVDVGAQGKRPKGGHDTMSSRSAYSGFPEEAVDLAYSLFLRDCTSVYDPFAGWGERGLGAQRYGKRYVGIDTSATAVALNTEKGSRVSFGDARYFTPDFAYDGVLTCPPYWNLERYEADGGLDRAKTWEGFLSGMDTAWARVVSGLQPGGVLVVVTGDWRKNNTYHDLTFQTERAMCGLGMVPLDKVVLSRKGVTKIKIMLPQAKRMGYTVRCHETMLVYRKP